MTVKKRGRREAPLGTAGRPVDPLGATIRAWRTYRGLSVTELAVKAGLGETGRAHISKLEHGTIRNPTPESLNPIAEALEISSHDLRNFHMPPSNSQPKKAEQSAVTSKPPSASGTFGSAVGLGEKESPEHSRTLQQEVDEIIAEFHLPYGERQLARRLILEEARTIVRVIKEELES